VPLYSLSPVHLSVVTVTKQSDLVRFLSIVALFISSQQASPHQLYTPSSRLQQKFNALPVAVNPMTSGARIPEKGERKWVVGLDVYTAGNNPALAGA
jgi:hypothetical protein